MANYRRVRVGDGDDCCFENIGCRFWQSWGVMHSERCVYYNTILKNRKRCSQCIADDEVDDE